MFCVALIESVLGERALALNDSDAVAREYEEGALLHAEGAVALVGYLDFGHVKLEDEGAAIAIAPIGLEGFSLGHVCREGVADSRGRLELPFAVSMEGWRLRRLDEAIDNQRICILSETYRDLKKGTDSLASHNLEFVRLGQYAADSVMIPPPTRH